MGRPFLYSLTYGEEGVVHAIESKSQSITFLIFSLSLGPTFQKDLAFFVEIDARDREFHVL